MRSRLLLLALWLGCRTSSAVQPDAAASLDAASLDATSLDAASLDAPAAGDDGPPTRRACTESYGQGLTSGYGRLDGILVAIVAPGPSSAPCNADPTHVHLQVEALGAVYDIAVNVGSDLASNDVHTATLDSVAIGAPWSEGWHTGVTTDYAALGVDAAALPLRTQAQTVAALMAELATVNHITVYGTGYSPTPTGAHLIHRTGGGRDGMLVTKPLSSAPRARLFRFSNQTF
jgi:hypothetical protein